MTRVSAPATTADTNGKKPAEGADKPSKLEQFRARYQWLDHLIKAGARYTERHGDHYAAAITFFSVLSLVPLIMIAFAAAGYVLFFNPELLDELKTSISENVPGSLAQTINPIINQAVNVPTLTVPPTVNPPALN